jgi:hypothetical protein
MMIGNLDASSFKYSYTFYKNEFEDILRGIIVCYNCINSSGLTLQNDENKIRDVILYNYLKVESFKSKHYNLANYHFDPETVEKTGRTDIRILPINPYLNDKAYFIIECKRLSNQNLTGTTGLNAEFVKNGICRFVTEYYSSYFKINAMIGFIIDDLRINSNILNLNALMRQDLINDQNKIVKANISIELTQIDLLADFQFSYTSVHNINSKGNLVLYHLMFNFSRLIQ